MTQQLKEKAMTGALWSLLGSSGYQLFGLLVFIVLSQQLTPTDFGIFAIALILVELCSPIINMGLTQTLVREEKLEETTKNTVFWITVTMGMVMAVGIFLTAGWMAEFYDEAEVEGMIHYLAIVPLCMGLSSVHAALLERNMMFKAIARRQIFASFISGIIAVVMVFNGAGVYSMIGQRVSFAIIQIVTLWYFITWRPKMSFSFVEAKRVCKMGSHLMTSTFVINFTRRAMDSVIGYYLGASALGYLRITAKIQDFVLKFTVDPLVKVALATFSRLQKDKQALETTYLRFCETASLVALPAFVGIAVIAPELIVYVFGEQWQPSVLLMQILCIGTISLTLNYFFKPLMISVGKTHYVLILNVIELVLVVGLVAIAAQFDLTMVMMARLGAMTAIMVISLFMIQQQVGVKVSQTIQQLTPPLVAVSIMGAVLLLMRYYFVQIELNPLLTVVGLIATGVLVYVSAIWFVFPRFIREIKTELLPLLKRKKKK